MDPISGVVEKKVAESVWGYVKAWFNRNQTFRKKVELLQAQLA